MKRAWLLLLLSLMAGCSAPGAPISAASDVEEPTATPISTHFPLGGSRATCESFIAAGSDERREFAEDALNVDLFNLSTTGLSDDTVHLLVSELERTCEDGAAGRLRQIAAELIDSDERLQPTPTPEPTPRPTPTPTPIPTPEPTPISYVELGDRDWQLLVKAPDDNFGNAYVVWGCITQFDAATGEDTFRAQASYTWLAYWHSEGDNALFTGDADLLKQFVQDDVVSMNVISLGSFSYDTQIGGNTTVPWFEVVDITLQGSCA